MRLSTQRFANGSFLYTEKSVYRRYELPDNELALIKIKAIYMFNHSITNIIILYKCSFYYFLFSLTFDLDIANSIDTH